MKLSDFDFRVLDNNNLEFLESVGVARFSKFLKDNKDAHFIEAGEVCFDEEREIKIDELDKENLEIELWTGFYDKNRKKIFENDIISCNNSTYTVKFMECEFRLYSSGNFFHSTLCDFTFELCWSINILVNIHENSDLLKKLF